MANRLSPTVRVAVSPSLFESVTIHPILPHFSLGMEEWTDSHLKSLEDKLSVQNTDFSLNQSTLSLELGDAMWNLLHLPTSEHAPKRVLIQPHPQDLELSPAKKCFQTLRAAMNWTSCHSKKHGDFNQMGTGKLNKWLAAYCWNQKGQWWSIPTINSPVTAFWYLASHALYQSYMCNQYHWQG